MVKIRQYLIPQNDWTTGRKKSPYSMTPEFVTIHNTANDASANNEARYVRDNVSSGNMSYHFAVDDIEAVQLLPLNRNGWHAGDGAVGTGNRKTIGIEICYSKSGGTKFTKSEQNAAKLTAKLLIERGWGIDRVKKHQDWSGKYCPHRTLDLGWQRFLNMVQAELNRLNKPIQPPAPTKPVWQAMMTPRKLTNLTEVNLIDLIADKTLATYKAGEVFNFDQWTKFKGIVWVRTAYSSANKLDRGFIFDRLSEVEPSSEPVEPPVPQEPEVQPEPPTEPTPEEPIVDPIQPPAPIEPPVVSPPPADLPSTNIWELIKQIIRRIKELLLR